MPKKTNKGGLISAQINDKINAIINKRNIVMRINPDGTELTPPKNWDKSRPYVKKVSWLEWVVEVNRILPFVKTIHLPNTKVIDGEKSLDLFLDRLTKQVKFLDRGAIEKIKNQVLLQQLNTHSEDINYLAKHCQILSQADLLQAAIKLIDPTIDLFTWQIPVTRDKRKIILLSGGRGRGASTLATLMILANMLAWDGIPIAGIRKAKQFVRISIFRALEATILKNPLLKELCHINRRDQVITMLHNRSVFYAAGLLGDIQKLGLRGLGALDNPGGGLGMAFLEEALDLTSGDFNLVMSSLRDNRAGYIQAIIAVNPGSPEHWINQQLIKGWYIKAKNKDATAADIDKVIGYYPATVEDNPLYDGSDYRDSLDNLTGHDYKRDRLGEWVRAGNMVFYNFNESAHVISVYDEADPFAQQTFINKLVFSSKTRIMVTIDGSRGTDPVSIMWWAIQEMKDKKGVPIPKVTIYREIHQQGIDESKYHDILSFFPDYQQITRVIISHEIPNEVTRLRAAMGKDRVIPVSEMFSKEFGYDKQGQGWRNDMIKTMNDMLGRNQVFYLDGALIGYNDVFEANNFLRLERRRVPNEVDYLKTLETMVDKIFPLKSVMVAPQDYDVDGWRLDEKDLDGSARPPRGLVQEIRSFVRDDRGRIVAKHDHAIDGGGYGCLTVSIVFNEIFKGNN